MAFPTAVNDQITDSVTQSNVHVLAQAPATSFAHLLQAHAHALALLLQNATHAQQQLAITAQAATTASVARLLGTGQARTPQDHRDSTSVPAGDTKARSGSAK